MRFLSDAFTILSNAPSLQAEQRLSMLQILAQSIGGQGMVLGQSLDIYWTKRENFTRQDLDEIHLLKTAALIKSSFLLGAISAGAPAEILQALQAVSERIGLAFQILDDLLDLSDGTGKSAGKDQRQGKLTYLAAMNEQDARKYAAKLNREAIETLRELPGESKQISDFIDYLLSRQN